MKTPLIVRVFFVLLAFVIGDSCLVFADVIAGQPIMSDPSHGWRVDFSNDDPPDKVPSVFHTSDGGQHWSPISPRELGGTKNKDSVCLCPLNTRCAWLAWTEQQDADERPTVELAFTADAGRSWRLVHSSLPADSVRISFVDPQHGFLLAFSEPAGGKMDKSVYRTSDGARSWTQMSIPPARSYYCTGISFRSRTDGWITGTYHGGDSVPLYHTTNGAKSWALQAIPIPAAFAGGYGYADTYPVVFIDSARKHGYLPIKLAQGGFSWTNFETQDGGKSWHSPAYIPPASEN